MNKWISVKDKLPTNGTSKLVWCPERKNKYTAIYRDGEWTHFGVFGNRVTEEVTHWMETPEPPPPPLTFEEKIIESIISTVQKVGRFPQWGEDLRPFAKTVATEIVADVGGEQC